MDDARVFLLVNTVETYLKLGPEEEAAPRGMPRAEGDTTVEATELTWADAIMQQGLERGLERGLEQGLEQGLERGLEQGLPRVLGRRFGVLPEALTTRLGAIHGPARLDVLYDAAVSAATLDEFTQALHRDD